MDEIRSTPSRSEALTDVSTIRTEDHVVWDEPDSLALGRLELGFVVRSWLLALLATVAIFALSAVIVEAISQRPLTSETNTELGVYMILAAMSTFIGFVVVMTLRLVRVAHDRVVNSLGVAALHVAFALVLFLAQLALESATGTSIGDVLAGPWTDQLGNVFSVLERSSAAAILACLLAIGMVPALGDRPKGTQRTAADTDHMM